MGKTRPLSATLQDYLETMSALIEEKDVARVRDIASAMDVHKSTVSAALRSLAEKDLVEYSPYEVATLTKRGRGVAQEVARGHAIIRRFLTEVLSLDEDVAEANACRIEHAIDEEALRRLGRFIEFINQCPRGGDGWVRNFVDFCRFGVDPTRCEGCLAKHRAEVRQTAGESRKRTARKATKPRNRRKPVQGGSR